MSFQWSLSLLRAIADAEIDDQEYVGPSQYFTVHRSLVRSGLIEATPSGVRRVNKVERSTYTITDAGLAILQVIDTELEGLRGAQTKRRPRRSKG